MPELKQNKEWDETPLGIAWRRQGRTQQWCLAGNLVIMKPRHSSSYTRALGMLRAFLSDFYQNKRTSFVWCGWEWQNRCLLGPLRCKKVCATLGRTHRDELFVDASPYLLGPKFAQNRKEQVEQMEPMNGSREPYIVCQDHTQGRGLNEYNWKQQTTYSECVSWTGLLAKHCQCGD